MEKSSTFSEIVSFLYKKESKYLGVLILVGFLVSLITVVSTASIYYLVALGTNTQEKIVSIKHSLFQSIESIIVSLPSNNLLVSAVVFFVLLEGSRLLLLFVQNVLTQYIQLKQRERFQLDLFEKYSNTPYREIINQPHGSIIYRTISAPFLVENFLILTPQFIIQTLIVLMMFILFFSISPIVTLALIILGIVFFLINESLGKLLIYNYSEEELKVREQQNSFINESLDGIKEIKTYNSLSTWSKKVKNTSDDYAHLMRKLSAFNTLPGRLLPIFSVAAVVATVIMLKLELEDAFFEFLPLISVFFLGLQRVIPTLSSLANARLAIIEGLPNIKLLYDDINVRSKPLSSGNIYQFQVDKDIILKSVSFSHDGVMILNSLDISFPTGKITAIVGSSGSGKSSILSLISGLSKLDSGSIFIGTEELKNVDLRYWRNHIGLVPQETFLLNGDLSENIAFGRNTTSDEIRLAAKLANAHSFIQSLPQGYHTIVGEQGLRLSGGQRQRIAIARAILKKPNILLFDEATSALDNQSETEIQSTIQRIARGRTVIIVAHRLSTIKVADEIIVIDNGNVVETGTHSTLIQKEEHYYQLYSDMIVDRKPALSDRSS